ncbi:hypothetical protein [Jiella mangrovi]|uniref:Uncharacterized protein n=1 Tax=Jiella mangrovi TaxID=2821407 RepID=A0ABS4BES0_9HYPH|nr:hypothetical protein [Jiella mangrovi]MBP0615257.1 hypothetical protein [Jiella mangrovi]
MSVVETILLASMLPIGAFVIAALVLRDSRRITEQAHARAKARQRSQ